MYVIGSYCYIQLPLFNEMIGDYLIQASIRNNNNNINKKNNSRLSLSQKYVQFWWRQDLNMAGWTYAKFCRALGALWRATGVAWIFGDVFNW